MSLDPGSVVLAALAALALVAFVDGVLVHLVRERLHRRPGARLEHGLHTGRAVLFPLLLTQFFAGARPTLGVVLLLLDQVLELVDMAIERRSRAYSAGLHTSEYLLHGAALTLRGIAVAATLVAGAASPAVQTLVDLLLPGAILGAILHVMVMLPWPGLGRARGAPT